MTNPKVHLNSQSALTEAHRRLYDIKLDGSYEIIFKKLPKRRTLPQNAALHVYFDLVSKELNAGGFDIQTVLAESYAREWTADLVKELLWKPLQKLLTDNDSTAEALKEDYSKTYDQITHHLGSIFGIYVPFPTKEDR